MSKKGIFITFEGPDGCGKTTIINLIYQDLQKKFGQENVVLTREPGGKNNIIAEDIRNILLNKINYKISDRTEALLFAASRAQHVKDFIIPNLESGKIILCDRYIDSSLVYQGYARNIGMENIWEINKFAILNTMPDFTILLMIEPEKGLARIQANKNRDVNRLDRETLDMHKKVYEGYKLIAQKYGDRIIAINAENNIDKVHQDTLDVVLKRIGDR